MHYSEDLCSMHPAVTHSLSPSLSPLHVRILYTQTHKKRLRISHMSPTYS